MYNYLHAHYTHYTYITLPPTHFTCATHNIHSIHFACMHTAYLHAHVSNIAHSHTTYIHIIYTCAHHTYLHRTYMRTPQSFLFAALPWHKPAPLLWAPCLPIMQPPIQFSACLTFNVSSSWTQRELCVLFAVSGDGGGGAASTHFLPSQVISCRLSFMPARAYYLTATAPSPELRAREAQEQEGS